MTGPSFQQQQRKSKGQWQTTTGNRGNQGRQNLSWSMKDMNFQGDGRRFQGDTTNPTASRHISSNTKCKLVNVHQLIKRLFSKEILTKVVVIPPIVTGKGLHDTIHQDTFSTKNSKFYKNEQETNCSRGFEIKEDVEERSNQENSTCSRRVSEKLLPCGQKRRRLSPCNQSKNVEPVRSFSPFQNGRPFPVRTINTGGRLDVQAGPEGCILQCPIGSELEEVCKVSVEEDSL